MEPREAAELLALMRGSWPNFAQDEVADRLWLEDLVGLLDAKSAFTTFRWLRDHEDFPPSWAQFRERYDVDERPSISEQIAIEGPPEPCRYGNGQYEVIRAEQREAALMQRVLNRPEYPQPLKEHFDATTPMLSYDEAVAGGLIKPALIDRTDLETWMRENET
jgi:hypothetical protein